MKRPKLFSLIGTFGAVLCALMACGVNEACAQSTPPALLDPPAFRAVDENGVDLSSGQYMGARHSLSIGVPGKGGMTWNGIFVGAIPDTYGNTSQIANGVTQPNFFFRMNDNYYGYIHWLPSPIANVGPYYKYFFQLNVVVGDSSESFVCNYNSTPICNQMGVPDGSTLTTGSDGYVFTNHNGDTVLFSAGNFPYTGPQTQFGYITSITKADGEVLTYTYDPSNPGKLDSVSNNFGYMIKYNYESSSILQIVGVNTAIEYCDPGPTVCSFSNSWPTLTINTVTAPSATSMGVVTVTDSMNETTTFSGTADGYYDPLSDVIQEPSGKTITITYDTLYNSQNAANCNQFYPAGAQTSYYYLNSPPACPTSHISSYSNGINTWNYSFSYAKETVSGGAYYYNLAVTVTDPLEHTREIQSLPQGQVVSSVDELNRTTTVSAQLPGNMNYGQISSITRPEGDAITYVYDTRGNVETVTRSPGSGSALPLVTSYVYPPSCGTPSTCNFPMSITDPNSNTTNYSYDPNSGELSLVLEPAVNVPGVGSVVPHTAFAHLPMTAQTLSSTGALMPEPTSVYLLTAMSTCATTASCVGGADEIRSTFVYATNNLAPTSVTSGSGDGVLEATTSTGFDNSGNAVSMTDPLGNVSNKTYDADRRTVFTIAPDPGSGTRTAAKNVYDVDGYVKEADKGSTTQASGSDFAVLEATTFAYDMANRKIQQTIFNGATTSAALAVTQYSYDAVSRPQCTAVRENSAVFSTLPTSACTQSTNGAYGSDQISQLSYDAAGEKTLEQRGVGSSVPINYAAYTYNGCATNTTTGCNGEVWTITDANGNLTTNGYDGFDRLAKMELPSPTLPSSYGDGTSDPTDYEGYNYDSNGNRVTLRKRDGSAIDYDYDALNRVTQKDFAANTNANVAYAYDLTGRRLSALYVNVSGTPGVVWTYDALDRVKTEATNGTELAYVYDLAGNRLSLTWPDGQVASYGYDGANRLTSVGNSGAGVGVTVGYDALSRITGLSQGALPSGPYNSTTTIGTNGVPGYDGADRVLVLNHNFSVPAGNVGYSFSYTPASQISAASHTNGAFDFAVAGSAITNTTSDGLNRNAAYAAVGAPCAASGAGYDCNGNLTYDGSRTFTYDGENRLLSESGPASLSLAYDPIGRLQQETANGTTIQFLYSGDAMVAEYSGSTVLRRYMHGAGVDRPLIWFEGSGVAASNASYLFADRQGSIIATADDTGTQTNVYTYDPYGAPGSWAVPAFGYTGQLALPVAGLWFYKARVYDPVSGRFLQTDPVGYESDVNLYAYVGEDPTNRSDPNGMGCILLCPVSTETTDESKQDNPLVSFQKGLQQDINAAAVKYGNLMAAAASFASLDPEAFFAGKSLAGADLAARELTVQKVLTYLLNPEHEFGGPKAAFFDRALGITKSNAGELIKQLQFDRGSATRIGETQFGEKFSQTMTIVGANGKTGTFRAIWQIDKEGSARGAARFITGTDFQLIDPPKLN